MITPKGHWGEKMAWRSLSWNFEANLMRNPCVIIKQICEKELYMDYFHGNGLTNLNSAFNLLKKNHTKQLRPCALQHWIWSSMEAILLATQQYPQNDWLDGQFPYTMMCAHGPHWGLEDGSSSLTENLRQNERVTKPIFFTNKFGKKVWCTVTW